MARHLRVRVRPLLGGVAVTAGATLVAGVMLGAPSFGAPAAGAAGVAVATTTSTTSTLPTTTSGSDTLTTSPTITTRTVFTGTTMSSCPGGGYHTPPAHSPGDVISREGFEDTTRNYTGVRTEHGTTAAFSTAAAAGGSRSVLVTGLTSQAGVETPNRTEVASWGWYKVTAKVRLAPGEKPAVVRLGEAQSPRHATVGGSARVDANGWTEVTAYARPMGGVYYDFACGDPSSAYVPVLPGVPLTLDVTSCGTADRQTSLYLDDIVFTQVGENVPTQPRTDPEPPVSGPAQTADCTGFPTTPAPTPTCQASYRVTAQPDSRSAVRITFGPTGRTTMASPWTAAWQFGRNNTVVAVRGVASWTYDGSETVSRSGPSRPLAPGSRTSVEAVIVVTDGYPTTLDHFYLDGIGCTISA